MTSLKTLVLGAAAAALLSPAASIAQDREEIQVIAPRLHVTPSRQLGIPERLSLSQEVSYSDLDLRDPNDARELRVRVRAAARDICDRLYEVGPRATANEPSCYRAAYENAMIRASEAIMDARYDRYYRTSYRRY